MTISVRAQHGRLQADRSRDKSDQSIKIYNYGVNSMLKPKKTFLILLVAVMMLTLLGVGANAATSSDVSTPTAYRLYLYLSPYGATDVSQDRLKIYSSRFVDVEELLVTTEYPDGVWLRVRDSETYAAATYAGQVYYHDSWWRPSYLSGYGIVGNEYYIKGQTASSSAYDASVTAYWIP